MSPSDMDFNPNANPGEGTPDNPNFITRAKEIMR
jgi:hypothetical protein